MKTTRHSDSDQEVLVHPAAELAPDGPLWHRLWTTPLSDLLRGRMSCRLDVRAIVETSGLPGEVRGLVCDTVKRTRLSRGEKAGIACELVAHFADALEEGVSPDEMLVSFGEVRTVAKLMRRAKLRGRAWPLRVMRRAGQALGVLVVVYVVAAIYFATARPEVSVDYLARMNAAVLRVPEEDRAWPVYREALLAIDRERMGDLLEMKGLEPGGAAWGEAVRFTDEHQAALATGRQAAAMKTLGIVLGTRIRAEDRDLWPEQYAEPEDADPVDPLFADSPETLLLAVRIPHVLELMRLQKLLVIDAALAGERGDGERVSASIAALLGMARQLRTERMVIEQLVAMKIVREAVDAMGEVLRRQPELLTNAQLRRLAHTFADVETLPMVRLGTERLWFDDLLQRIYTDDGRGDGHLVPGALGVMRIIEAGSPDWPNGPVGEIATAPLANVVIASRKDMAACYQRIMDRYEARFAMPYWEARRSAEVGDEFRSSMSFLEKVRYLFVSTSVPAFDRVYRAQEDTVGRRDGLLVALALEVHRRQHGEWPESLDELVPDLLPGVPRDRFTGEPLSYRADGGEVLVYSVGSDLDDDGGVLPGADAAQNPDQSVRERFRMTNKRAGVRSEETPDGDWILWHSAPLESIQAGRRDQDR